ncbi:hypothetical protein WA026_022966 [Henosepilachna vigintioctopunctata]|uniref:Uncharacterized protein n=1 Tax=Henosepilachna vigintioctopunctata TaxID=420089 RepID=A0AAW1TXW8_9CUCU
MAESEVVDVDRSSKNLIKDLKEDNICGYCCRKVLDYISCTRCDGIFHPSCMSKLSSGKTPACLHVPMEKRSETEASEMDLRMENSYLKTLVEELKSKNEILIQNNALLIDKLSLNGNNGDRNDRKNVNKASKSNTVKLATVSDSVVSALTMRPRQNLRDISSENINIHNLNKRAGDPERIHELKPSDLTKNDEKIMSQEKRENLLQNEWTEIKSRRNKSPKIQRNYIQGHYIVFLWSSSEKVDLCGYGVEAKFHEPTRITTTSSTCLDNILTNFKSCESSVFEADLSDHRGQKLEIQQLFDIPEEKIKVRQINGNSFSVVLHTPEKDVNILWNNFSRRFGSLFRNNFKEKLQKVKNNPLKPNVKNSKVRRLRHQLATGLIIASHF